MKVVNGTTDVITYFVLRDSTNHAPKTDVTVTDIDLYYVIEKAAISAKVDATALSAATDNHTDNYAFNIGQGVYRIDWPDTCFDGGVGTKCILIVVCSGVDTTFLEVELIGTHQTGDSYAIVNGDHGLVSIQDDVDAIKTKTDLLPAVAAGAADGLVIGSAAYKLAVDAAGKVAVPDTQKVDVNTIKTVAVAATATVTFQNGTIPITTNLGTAQTGDSYAIVNGDHGLVSIQDDIDAIKAKTDKLTYTSGNDLDANVQKINDVTLTGNGSTTPWGPA